MKGNDVARLVFILLIVALSVWVAFFPSTLTVEKTIQTESGQPKTVVGPKYPYRLGLDLQGGVHVVLEAEKPAEGEITDEAMERTVAVLQNRVNSLGVADTIVQRQGNKNRILVDLPGYQDKELALSILGRTARLEFRKYDGTVILTGEHVKSAKALFGPGNSGTGNEWQIAFELDAQGTTLFADATREAAGYPKGDEKNTIAIYLDEDQLMNPGVNDPIETGSGVITSGGGDLDSQRAWATQNALLIEGGALPLQLNADPAELRVVGASLGQDTVNNVGLAAIIAILLIAIYMLLYYRGMGFFAVISLAIYACIYLALLLLVGATFSLPAIGAAILSVGMAVDANVIIFERIKEELADGKTPTSAVANGFSKGFSTIFDANFTTLVGAGVLYWLATGPVKGFAVTLAFGIFASFFTALFVARFLMDMMTKLMKPAPGSKMFNFLYGVGGRK
ncbi:MAG: protein translocase subunit SecD [Caldisericia bacterium]